jgi:hypothetical protein
VKQFSPDFSEADVAEDFRSHFCDDVRFRRDAQTESVFQMEPPSPKTAQLLRDLCGLEGAVLASIERLSSTHRPAELLQVKSELDRVRSLLWLHLYAKRSVNS